AQANPPHQPPVNPQGAQANTPQQPHAATPIPGAAAHNLAAQAIPPAALAGAAALGGHEPSNHDATAAVSTPLPAMSGGQPTDNDQTPSEPKEYPDQDDIGTIVKPPMPSYVPAQPQIDEHPNNAPDEYTQPAGTTYKIPGQPDPPAGPPPNAIPIVPHPTTAALPDTGSAIPLTDRPQVPIPDTAVPGAPTEDDRDGHKPRVHDSEPPLPRHNNTPAPHLPATPADRPTELNPPSHYATTPNPETPGAPTDPSGTPQLNRHSTDYIGPLTVQPTRGGAPSTTPAGPLPQPVVPARPVPMMASASVDKRKKRKPEQKTPPPQPPQPTPKPPAPIPVPTPQPTSQPSRPSAPPARAKVSTRSARTTGRDLAITFASASGAAAITVPALAHTRQRGHNLAETVLAGGGLATATRPTSTTSTPVRPFAATTTELDHSWLAGLLLPTEPESADQHAARDGHAPRPHADTIAEIEQIGRAIFDELGLPDDHSRTQPPASDTQPPTTPANAPDPSNGWSAWDQALQQLTLDTYPPAPTDPITTPTNPSSTGHPSTAELDSSRTEIPQPSLTGTILDTEDQPDTAPASILPKNTPTTADTTHTATTADLGATGNEPEPRAQPLIPHTTGADHKPSTAPTAPHQAGTVDPDFFDNGPDESGPATTPTTQPSATQANPPRPAITPHNAQTESPQQRHTATPPLDVDTNDPAAQPIPPTAPTG
ncbi:hypothetical protein AB0L58_42970, partial [Nocardia sp. NPDC052112]